MKSCIATHTLAPLPTVHLLYMVNSTLHPPWNRGTTTAVTAPEKAMTYIKFYDNVTKCQPILLIKNCHFQHTCQLLGEEQSWSVLVLSKGTQCLCCNCITQVTRTDCDMLYVHTLDLRVGLLNPPGPLGRSPIPSRTSGWAYQPLPDLRVGLPSPPRPPGRPPDQSRTSGRTSQPLPELRVGFPTPPGPPGEE